MIDKNLTHQRSGNGKEMSPVFEGEVVQTYQPQVDLVYESSRLERVSRAFSPDMPASHAAELGVHQRNQPIEGRAVSLPPRSEQFGDLVTARARDCISRHRG
jgi:hypothetical protein